MSFYGVKRWTYDRHFLRYTANEVRRAVKIDRIVDCYDLANAIILLLSVLPNDTVWECHLCIWWLQCIITACRKV